MNLNSVKMICNKARYYLLKMISHKRSDMTPDEARKILVNSHEKPATSCIRLNELSGSEYDLQIIVPVYNVEKYLEECLESITNQETSYSFCVTLVDDGSTDTSGAICDRYCKDNARVNVIHQSNNGLSGARNAGLTVLNANYIMFVDSDDYLESDAVQRLLDRAYEEEADIVYGSHARIINGEQVIYRDFDKSIQIGDKLKIPGFAWGKVYKTELFKTISFPEGFWFEDSINRFLVFNIAEKIYYIPDIVYNYRILSTSISHSSDGKLKNIDTYWLTEILVDDYKKLGLRIDKTLLDIVLNQSKINWRRVRTLDVKIQEAVFVLTCQLISETFSDEVLKSKNHPLLSCYLNLDFGGYKLWCSTH